MADKTDIPTWVKVVTGVMTSAVVIWGTAWAASRSSATTDFVVQSHERRITNNDLQIVNVKTDMNTYKEEVDKRFDQNEQFTRKLEGDQRAILAGQERLERQYAADAKIRREDDKEKQAKMDSLVETVIQLDAYLRTIETIE